MKVLLPCHGLWRSWGGKPWAATGHPGLLACRPTSRPGNAGFFRHCSQRPSGLVASHCSLSLCFVQSGEAQSPLSPLPVELSACRLGHGFPGFSNFSARLQQDCRLLPLPTSNPKPRQSQPHCTCEEETQPAPHRTAKPRHQSLYVCLIPPSFTALRITCHLHLPLHLPLHPPTASPLSMIHCDLSWP